MAEIIFIFEGKEICIQCQKNELFKTIFEKFQTKIDNKLSHFFLYSGNKILPEKTFDDIANIEDKKNCKMKILVCSEKKDNNKFYPISRLLLQAYEKKYILDDESIDIGYFLNKININIYDRIIITLKKGNYFWNEFYHSPEHVFILLINENYDCHCNNHHIKITINKETNPCYCCSYNKHQSYTKLMLERDSTVEFRSIDIDEYINDINNLCPGGNAKAIFSLNGDNSRLYLLESTNYISCSPFINVLYMSIGKVFFQHTHFMKNKNCRKDKIYVVGAIHGWNSIGKAFISSSYSTLDNNCFFYDKTNKNQFIEFISC